MKSLEQILKHHKASFYSVVPFRPGTDKLLLFDFSQQNRELTEELVNDTNRFTAYINQKLQTAQAQFGIGGYAEQRTIYSRSDLFSQGENEEPRRVHLGIDIWGKPFTHVRAPLDGFVHSFAFNSAFGDYGATILLTHQLEGHTFYTLYGHLSLASITNFSEGERIKKGDVFAEFGIPQENGGWPPHLHFQVIHDLEGRKGDYPGVCTLSQKDSYLANCPNPDCILNMMQYAVRNLP